MNRGIGAVLACLGAMALMAGCGSDSETTSLTKAEFVKQGSAICAKGLKTKDANLQAAIEKEAAANPAKVSQTTTQERLVTEVALPPIQAMASELGELEAPSGDEAQVEAMVESLDGAIVEIEESPADALTEVERIFGGFRKEATKYGLEPCAAI